MSERLYFIAAVPPADIQQRVTALKLEIAEKYGSRHALKSPPHITLHMPFRWKDTRWEELNACMRAINEGLTAFEVQLRHFGFFAPRVVFVDVVKNPELGALQKRVVSAVRSHLKLTNANYRDLPFHPHMTIAFRDLKKADFFQAQEEFAQRPFEAAFQVSEAALLRHNGERWEVVSD